MKDVYESDYYNHHHQMSTSASLSQSAIQINQAHSKRSNNGSGGNNGTVLGRFLKLGKSRSDANSHGHGSSKRRGDVDAEDEFRLTISSSAQNLRGAEKMVHKANLRKDNVSKSHSWIFGPTKSQPVEHAPFGYNPYGPPSPSGAQFAADNYLQHSPSRHPQLHPQHPAYAQHQVGPSHSASYGNLEYSSVGVPGHGHHPLQHIQNSHHMQMPMPMPMYQPMPMEYCGGCEYRNHGLLAPTTSQELCHACNINALAAANNAKFMKNRKQPTTETESKTFASSVRKLTWKSLKQAVKKRPSIDSLKSPPPPGTADTSWSPVHVNNTATCSGNFVDAAGQFMSQDDVLNATTTNYFFPEKKYQKAGGSSYYGSCTDLFTGVSRNGSGLGSSQEPPQHVTASVRVRPKRSRETWHFPNELGPTPNYQQQEHGAYHSDWDLRNYTPYEEWLTVTNSNTKSKQSESNDDSTSTAAENASTLKSIGEPFEVTLVHSSNGSGSESGSIQNAKASAKVNRPSPNSSNNGNVGGGNGSGSNCNGTTINCNNVNSGSTANNNNNGKGVSAAGGNSASSADSSSTSLSTSGDIYSYGGVKRFSILNNELNAYQLNKRNQNGTNGKSRRQQDGAVHEMEQTLTDEEEEEEEDADSDTDTLTGEESHVRVAGQGITIIGNGSRVVRSNSSSSTSKKAPARGNHPHHLVISSSESDLVLASANANAKSNFSTFTGHYARSNVNVNGGNNVSTTRITNDGIGSTGPHHANGNNNADYENHYSSSFSNNRDSSTSSSDSNKMGSTNGANNSNVKIRSIVKSQKRERENGTTTVELLDNSSASSISTEESNTNTKNFAPSQKTNANNSNSATNGNASKSSSSGSNPKYGALRRRKQRSGKHSSKNLLRETIYEEEDSSEEANAASRSNGGEPDANGIYTVKILVNSNSQSTIANSAGSDYSTTTYVKPILKTNSHYASVTNSITNSMSNGNTNSNSDPDYCSNYANPSGADKNVKFTSVRVPKKKVQFNKEKVVIMCGVDDHTSDDSDGKTDEPEVEPEPYYNDANQDESQSQANAEAFNRGNDAQQHEPEYSDWDSGVQGSHETNDYQNNYEDSGKSSINSSTQIQYEASREPEPAEEYQLPEEQDASATDADQAELDYSHNRNNNFPATANSQFNSSNEVNNLVGYEYVTSNLLKHANANNGNQPISVSSSGVSQVNSNSQSQVHRETQQQQQESQHKYNKRSGNSSNSVGAGKAQLAHQNQILNKRNNRMKVLNNNNNANPSASTNSKPEQNQNQNQQQVFAQERNGEGKEDDKRKLVYHENHEHDSSERTRRVVQQQSMVSSPSAHKSQQQQARPGAGTNGNANLKTAKLGSTEESEMHTKPSTQNMNHLPLKAEQIFNNKHQAQLNKGGRQGAKILNPNSLLFNDTTRIRLNQARPSLDQTFQIMNLTHGSESNQGKSLSPGSGPGILRKNNGVRPSHSFRTSAPPTAPLRPREPPPPPPPTVATTPTTAIAPGARPQLPARPKSFPASLTNSVKPNGSGSANSHYRSPTTKAQISLPMPMLGFSTTNSNMNVMKMKPTTGPSEQSPQNSPRTKSQSSRPTVKKSANSNSSMADKREAVEKVLSQKLGKITTNKISSPIQSKTSTTNNQSNHYSEKGEIGSNSPVYANVPFSTTNSNSTSSPVIGKPLPPPPVPPHQILPSTPTSNADHAFNPTPNELLRVKSNLISNGKSVGLNERAVTETGANNSNNVEIRTKEDSVSEVQIYSDTTSATNDSPNGANNSAKNHTTPQEVHYAATDLFDKHGAFKLLDKVSMEDEINYHHSHYNGPNNSTLPLATTTATGAASPLPPTPTSVVHISDNEGSTVNTNKNHYNAKTSSASSPSPAPSNHSHQSIDLISGPRTQDVRASPKPSQTPSPLPPPPSSMSSNKMNGSLMHARIEDKVVGQPDKSNKSQEHVQAHVVRAPQPQPQLQQHRLGLRTETTKNVLTTEQDHKGNEGEEEPLYDDVVNHAMNRVGNNNKINSKVQPCAQPNLNNYKTYAISPPKDAPPPIPPHSASFIASLSKSTGSLVAQQLKKVNNDNELIYDDNAVIRSTTTATSTATVNSYHCQNANNDHYNKESKNVINENPKPVASLSDANTNLVHFTEEDLIYDDTSAFNTVEPTQEEPLTEPLYDDVLNFAKFAKRDGQGQSMLEEQDSGTESNSPPPPLPTSGPPVHLLPKISLELPVILSTAVPGLPGSCNNTLKSIKEAKNKNRRSTAAVELSITASQPQVLSQSKSHSDLTSLINETIRLSKANGSDAPQLNRHASTSVINDRNASKMGDDELLDKTRSLLNELNEKLAKFSGNPTSPAGSAVSDYSMYLSKLGHQGTGSNGNVNGNGTPGSSSSDSSSGVEEDYNSERNYSLSLNEDDCATLTPNSSTSSPASGSLQDDNAYKLSQVSKLVNETMALARGKFLDSMKLQQERAASAASNSQQHIIEEPIYEEINESKSNSSEFHNQRNLSSSPIYADTFDAKSIFDGASRVEILSFLESIRDRLAAVDSSSNSLGQKQKSTPSGSVGHGNGNKKSKKTKDIERNDSGIGSEAGSIVAILGAVGAAAAAQNGSGVGSGFLTLCKDCHSLPIEAAADDAATTETRSQQICSPCIRKRNERKEIIQEIYETELKYGRDLRIISDEFYNPIQVAGLLTKEQLELIFLNVVQLIEINVELTSSLKTNIEDSIKTQDEDLMNVSIGRIFLDLGEKMMSGFESYCTRQANAGALLTQLEKEKELLRIFLRVSQMENAVLRRMNLPAFLMVPVQRVTRYPLLLSRLLKVTSTDHPSHDELQMAAEQIETHLEHMNNTTREVASNKLWKRISIINGGSSSPIHRRSSTSSTNSDLDGNNNGANARIRKVRRLFNKT